MTDPHLAGADVVLDTNVVLDWLLFEDPRAAPLGQAVAAGQLRWWRSESMALELDRVLDYPALLPWLSRRGQSKAALMARAAQHATEALAAPPAPLTLRCADPDDQCFIDLALARPGSRLISRDNAVLALRKRALGAGIEILTPAQWAARRAVHDA